MEVSGFNVMVELRQVTKQFGTATVLHNINLQIPEGEFLTLLGPSGCGKTTLLRIIAGFVEPTSGDAILAGQNLIGDPPNKRQVAMLFQTYALSPHITV